MDILSLAVILCLGVVVLLCFMLVKRLEQTLNNVDKTLATLNDAISGLHNSAVLFLDKTESLENKIDEVLTDTSTQLHKIEESVLPLMVDVKNLTNTYDRLGNNLDLLVNTRLTALFEHSQAILENFSAMSKNLEYKLSQIDAIFKSINKVGNTINDVITVVRPGALGVATEIASVTAGVKTALNFLINKRKEK